MMKKIFATLVALLVFVSAFGVVANAETAAYVIVSNSLIDNGYMSEDELVDLQARGIEVENIYGYAVLFAVVDEDLVEAYESPENLYYELTDNPNGLIFVHDEVNDVYEIYLAGDCKEIFGDETERIEDAYYYESTYYDGIASSYYEVEDIATAFNSQPPEDGYGDSYTDGYIEPENGGDTDYGYIEDETDADYNGEEYAETETESENLPSVIDEAGILKEAEIKEIDKKFKALSKEYKMDFVAATVEDTEGLSLNEYADMLHYVFKSSGSKEHVFFIYQHGDEGEREIVIVRYGKNAEKELSDADCTKIINAVKKEFTDGNYAKGFEKIAKETEKVFNPSVHWVWIPVCLVVGLLIAFLIMKGIASANKSVRKKADAKDYVNMSSLMVTNSEDIFLYSDVKTTAKSNTTSSDTDSGGRSTSSGKF